MLTIVGTPGWANGGRGPQYAPPHPRDYTAALASALQGVAAGSLLNWAIHRDGTVVDWVRRDVETVISPYARGR